MVGHKSAESGRVTKFLGLGQVFFPRVQVRSNFAMSRV